MHISRMCLEKEHKFLKGELSILKLRSKTNHKGPFFHRLKVYYPIIKRLYFKQQTRRSSLLIEEILHIEYYLIIKIR